MTTETTQMTLIKFTYPWDFGLITCTQVGTIGFDWLLKATIHSFDLSACNQCGYKGSVSFWTPDRPLHWYLWILSHGQSKREKVIELYKTGEGYKKISKELRMPISHVQTLIKKWKMRDSFETKPWSGRSTKLSSTTARKIVRDAKKNPQMTTAEIQDFLTKSGVDVSQCTIRRHCMGLHGHVVIRKPLLRQCHKKNQAYNMPNSTETSHKTSGTKSFGVMGPKLNFLATTINTTFGEESTRPMMMMYTIPTVKHGDGSLMFWGFVSHKGTGNLVKIDGKMNAARYQKILEEEFALISPEAAHGTYLDIPTRYWCKTQSQVDLSLAAAE